MIFHTTEFFITFLFKIIDKVNLFPRIVVIKYMTPEALTLFAKFHTCVTTYETVVFKIRHYG